MEDTKLADLIRSLEISAAQNPGGYKLRVALLAVLGYAYLLVLVTALLAIVVATLFYVSVNWLMLKILWIPLVLVGIVLRSLWVAMPEPDGVELKREQAPTLFDLIDEVTNALSGPKIHHVLLWGDFNAGIVQIPRFGMFGWQVNYLVIGLPMLRAITPTEFRAVLAHEVGHLSGKHSSFSSWIYRVRRSWFEILDRVQMERAYAAFLFEPFLKWYAPYLGAYSFVLARAQELQADEFSVELAGKETAALTLSRTEIKGRGLNETFWPGFFRQSKEEPKAPRDPFEQMLKGLDQPTGAVNAQKWFFEALRVPSGYDDAHPSLADRLAAIGYHKDSPQLAGLIDVVLEADTKTESAAAYYLRELPEGFLFRQNQLYRENLVEAWNASHAEINEARRKLKELENKESVGPLTIEEKWQRVSYISQVEDNKAMVPYLETILKEAPDHLGANFAMGAILLTELKNPEGIAYLEKAMKLNQSAVGDASSLLSSYYLEQGNKELAESFRQRAVENYERQQKQQQELMNFSARDHFIAHELKEEQVKAIQGQLYKVRGLSEAFLFRKVVEGCDPVYVFAFFAGNTWFEGTNDKHLGPLFEDLNGVSGLPSPLIFLALDMGHLDLLPKIQSLPGASVYKRS